MSKSELSTLCEVVFCSQRTKIMHCLKPRTLSGNKVKHLVISGERSWQHIIRKFTHCLVKWYSLTGRWLLLFVGLSLYTVGPFHLYCMCCQKSWARDTQLERGFMKFSAFPSASCSNTGVSFVGWILSDFHSSVIYLHGDKESSYLLHKLENKMNALGSWVERIG